MSDTITDFQEVEMKIELFANLISDEIQSRQVFNKAELRTFIRPRLLAAVEDIIHLRESDLMSQLDGLKAHYATLADRKRAAKVAAEIIELKARIRKYKAARNTFTQQSRRQSKLRKMTDFFKERHPGALNEFYENNP